MMRATGKALSVWDATTWYIPFAYVVLITWLWTRLPETSWRMFAISLPMAFFFVGWGLSIQSRQIRVLEDRLKALEGRAAA